MILSHIFLVTYASFLAVILVINLLYFFQVFRYHLPGDDSVTVLIVYVIVMLVVLFTGEALII